MPVCRRVTRGCPLELAPQGHPTEPPAVRIQGHPAFDPAPTSGCSDCFLPGKASRQHTYLSASRTPVLVGGETVCNTHHRTTQTVRRGVECCWLLCVSHAPTNPHVLHHCMASLCLMPHLGTLQHGRFIHSSKCLKRSSSLAVSLVRHIYTGTLRQVAPTCSET